MRQYIKKLTNKTLFSFNKIKVNLPSIIYVLLLVPSIIFTIQSIVKYEIIFNTDILWQIFISFSCMLLSVIIFLHHRLFESKLSCASIMSSFGEHLIRKLIWFTLFLGMSKALSIYQQYSHFLFLQKSVVDFLMFVVIYNIFVLFFKSINELL